MDYFLRRAYHGQLGDHRARRHGPSHDWLELMVATVLMQPVFWFGAMWLHRRKVAELNEVKRLLEEIQTIND